MSAFLKKSALSYALALVFLTIYETVRVSIALGEFRFVGPLLATQLVSSFLILSFVAVLSWISFTALAWYADSNLSFSSGVMEMIAMVTVYAVCLIALYFVTSPFMSWVLTLFPGPHQSLFEFYWASWQRFDGFDALALIMASSMTGFLIVLGAILCGAWENGLQPRRYPVS